MYASRMNRVTEVLDGEVSRAARHGRALSVLLVDVDDLRGVNDALGREAGDLVVARLPGLIRACLRDCDLAVHAGGDEVAVVLPETGAGGARAVADRIRAAAATAPLMLGGRRVPVRVSVGVAEHRPGMSAEQLVLAAEDAVRALKWPGRAGWSIAV